MDRCCQLLGLRSQAAPAAKSAQEQGLEGIHEMMAAYRKISELALPPGAALVLASMRREIARLEELIGNASFPESRPWKLPLVQEQSDWEKVYPKGGVLLWRQLCTASTDEDGDCFLGGLFVSDAGIAFDTGANADESERLQTGLLKWAQIADLQRTGSESQIKFSLTEGAKDFQELRIQLTIESDAEWIEEFWKLQSVPKAVSEGKAVDEQTQEDSQPPASADTAAAQPADQSPKGEQPAGEGPPVLLKQLSGPASPKAHRSLSMDSKVSGVFNEAPEGRKPFQAPQKDAPVGTDSLANTSLPKIGEALRGENYLAKFIRDAKKARDISMTPWSESKKAPGVLVRKTTFTLPVPQDFPRAVTRLVNLPTETKVTAIYRLHEQSDALIFTVQFCSHDIPFGENFRVHETVQFKPNSNGGVEATKWVEVMWIAALPWTHGVLKAIIEQKSKADGLGNYLVAAIKETCA